METEIRERTDAYIHARHHHPAWQLLAARRAPLILSCLQTLFDQSQDGVGFDDALRALAEMLADRGNAGEFEISDEDFAAQARKELRSWIKLSLVVEREGRVYATDAFEEALRFVTALGGRIMTSTASRLSVVQREIEGLESSLNPDAVEFTQRTADVREHFKRWRTVGVGRVLWERVTFRGGGEPVEVPVQWLLDSPSEWAAACGGPAMRKEFERLGRLVAAADPIFHRTLVRQRYLLQDRPEEEIAKAIELARVLTPGFAAGRPLRALGACGVDSKFFERHRALIVQLLDARFDGQVSDLGLEAFLEALDEGEHWLLVAPLASGLLPFAQQRVRAREISAQPLPGSHVVIVENERCLHQLPSLPDTVAVLGAGLNLEWLSAAWFQDRRIAYWGDLDTWGLRGAPQAKRKS